MTIDEMLIGCEHDGSFIPVWEVKRLMKEFTKIKCAEQRKICSKKAVILEDFGIYVDPESIINAPEPDII